MVGQEKSKQLEGFDIYDYQPLATGRQWGINDLDFMVAGDGINFTSDFAALWAAVPLISGDPASVGPQYPWPYEGDPGQFHPDDILWMPVNPAHVQRTTFRILFANHNIMVYFFDQRLARILSKWLARNPDAMALGPTAGNWPMPVGVPLYGQVGNYTFERKWVWLFYQTMVPDTICFARVYLWG